MSEVSIVKTTMSAPGMAATQGAEIILVAPLAEQKAERGVGRLDAQAQKGEGGLE